VHSSLLIHDFLTKLEMKLVPQPPDLASAHFCLFTKTISVPKGWRFESVKEIKVNLLAELCSIPKEAFQVWFQNWKKRWERSITSREGYNEGDKAQLLQSTWGNDLFKLFRIFMDRPCISLNTFKHTEKHVQ